SFGNFETLGGRGLPRASIAIVGAGRIKLQRMMQCGNGGIMIRSIILLAVILALFLPHYAMSQTTGGTVQGNILAESGEHLAGAVVTAKNLNTGIARNTKSDQDGFYRLTELRVGQYEISVSLSGFTTQVRSGVSILIGQQSKIDFAMKIAS